MTKVNVENQRLLQIEDKHKETIANILLSYRNLNGYTQLDMVKLIGCSLASYRLWEVGATRPLKFVDKLEEMLV